MKNKIKFGVILLLILSLILNPTINDIKSFIGYNEKTQVVQKTKNFLVFSVYDVYTKVSHAHGDYKVNKDGLPIYYTLDGRYSENYVLRRYIGFMKNFW